MAKLRDMWQTPQSFVDLVAKRYRTLITVDVCASAQDRKCPFYITEEQDGLSFKAGWTFHSSIKPPKFPPTFWCNPGFSDVTPWIELAIITASHGGTTFLLAHDNFSSRWFGMGYDNAAYIDLLSPRIQFEPPHGITKSSNEHSNSLLVFTPHCARGEHAAVRLWRWRKDV